MIGRFLEISLPAPEILESIAWWEALGFRQVDTNDAWRHPYAVVSDGRTMVGLHQRRVEETTLTFVRPDLADHLERLSGLGVEFEFMNTGDEQFHEAGFVSPDAQRVLLLESRTCSPPAFDDHDFSVLGRLDALHLPARRIERTLPFWAKLGLAVLEFDEDAPTTAVLTDGHLTVLLDEDSRVPAIAFRSADIDDAAAVIAARVGEPERTRDGGLKLTSPEGLILVVSPP